MLRVQGQEFGFNGSAAGFFSTPVADSEEPGGQAKTSWDRFLRWCAV